MSSKKITLSVPEQILKELNKEKQRYTYTSIQQVIIQMLRDQLYMKQKDKAAKTTTNKGRPRKFDEMRFLTRKKPIFVGDKGEAINL